MAKFPSASPVPSRRRPPTCSGSTMASRSGASKSKRSDLPDTAQWLHLRQLYGSIPEAEWILAGRAAQIMAWDRDHRFCGRCGTATNAHERDRARECPSCGVMAYPRLNPAVIMLVERDDGRPCWPGGAVPGSLLSAPWRVLSSQGRSLEETVVREVREEVGIEMADVSYFGSQPWPFPHSMMIGFNARYVSGEIAIQEEEIVEADWYHHEELPPVPKGGMSIAGWLIEDWINRQNRT